jgi:hypothetical protein
MAGAQDQLRKLNETVTRIKVVIQDAEEQAQKQNHQIEDWLMKLYMMQRICWTISQHKLCGNS